MNLLDVGYLQYELLEGLLIKGTAGVNYQQRDINSFAVPVEYWNFRTNTISQPKGPNGANASSSFNRTLHVTLNSILTYTKTLAEVHNISALLGYSQETSDSRSFFATGGKIYTESTPVLDAALDFKNVGGAVQNWRMRSGFSRLGYNYRGKYLLEANFRADGSSRFSRDYRWGYFPSFSAGWRVTDEPFAQPITKVVSDLKIRGSWGKLGNNALFIGGDPNRPDNYAYQNLYSSRQNYNFGGQPVVGVAPTGIPNEQIQWETTTITNVGADIGLFNNRVTAEADVFNRLTDGILYQLNVPNYIGNLDGPFVNLAEVRNWGWSLAARYQQKVNDFEFGLGGNITSIENEVTKYQGPNVRTGVANTNGNFIVQEGLPINSIYGYQALGIFRSQEEIDAAPVHTVVANNPRVSTSVGDLQFADLNGDGQITPLDRTVIGNVNPKHTYGLNANIGWKGLDLSLLFNGVAGQDALLTGQYFTWDPEGSSGRKINAAWLDRVTPENPDGSMPRVANGYNFNNNVSSFWVTNGAYLRLRNAQLMYSLPENLISRIKMKALRVYVNGQNLVTWTKFKGNDPEQTPLNTTINFPNVKVYSLGLNASF